MQSALDQAITVVAAAEATFQSSVGNVATIQSNIAAATSPLAPAQTQLSTDQAAYVASLQALDSVIQSTILGLTALPA